MTESRSPKEIAKAAKAENRKREEAERRKRHQAQEAADKERARAAWVKDGGDEGDFERQWPSIRDQSRAERVQGRQRQERRDADRRQLTRF